MTTLKEIAALAGVSRGTVDRVLNNRGSVNPETEKRIREIVHALNYQPNKAALALAAQKKKITLGVLLFGENNGNKYFDDVVEGVEYQREKLEGYGCTILINRTSFDIKAQLDAINDFIDLGIHGLVISPYNAPEISSKINELYDMGIPTITTNTDISDSKRIAYVGSNYYQCGRTAGGLMGLITNGTAKVGIITGSPLVLCHTERINGFLDTIHSQYPKMESLEIIANQDDEFQSYKATSELLAKYPEMNALYFTAAGVYGGCRAVLDHHKEHKLKIISFAAVETTKQMLRDGVISATICQQPFQQGSRPVKLLFDYLSTGVYPADPLQYTEASIKIRENI